MANTPREFQQCRRAPSFAVPPSICFSPENEWSPLNTEGGTELRRLGPKDDQSSVAMACSIGIGCSQLAWRLSSPSLECMSECAHLMKAEQPRNLGYMHLAVVEVTNR
jgi:hypothetical protein